MAKTPGTGKDAAAPAPASGAQALRRYETDMLARIVRSGSGVYGYMIEGRRAIFSEAAAAAFGVPSECGAFPAWEVENKRVSAQSIPAWNAFFDAIDRGEMQGEAEVNLQLADGAEGRYRLRFTGIPNAAGQSAYALVYFDDISREFEEKRLRALDIGGLLQATKGLYSEILLVNLSRNRYHMIQYDAATTRGTPRDGVMDTMISIRIPGVAPEDREDFVRSFSRESLLRTFGEEGQETVRLVYRRPGKDGRMYWFETIAMRLRDPYADELLAVAVSRSLDAEKAEESRLREELRLQQEELRLTLAQMRKAVFYYDVPESTLRIPPAYAMRAKLPEHIPAFPECILSVGGDRLPPQTQQDILDFFASIRRGERHGVCDLQLPDAAGGTRWEQLEFVCVLDAEGKARRAVITSEDVSDIHAQDDENRRLKENERILRLISEHSERTILYYDLKNWKLRAWNKDTGAAGMEEGPYAVLLDNNHILPESKQDVEDMFQNIHSGSPEGELRVRVRGGDGAQRWLDLKYSAIYDGGIPTAALLSYQDVTELYEHEMAYLRFHQHLEDSKDFLGTLEVDLDNGRIEKQGGRLLPPYADTEGQSFDEFAAGMVKRKLHDADHADALRFFSRAYLLAQHAEGHNRLQRTWKMYLQDGSAIWVRTVADLVSDPYKGHVRALFQLRDITGEKEAQLAVLRRSQQDGMTGLLNRATCEERIRFAMDGPGKPGIMLLIDLDDLKGINDSLGHAQGDRAICSLAQTLVSHFRENDIIGRVGGDEFMVFLPGAGHNAEAIRAGICALLRKCAQLTVGGHDERSLQCSIGCAVQLAQDDSFEAMYARADRALYHVKRGSKNNFAFYTPDMEESRAGPAAEPAQPSFPGAAPHLPRAAAAAYPTLFNVNLESGRYDLITANPRMAARFPSFGTLGSLREAFARILHPDDAAYLDRDFSPAALLASWEAGRRRIRRRFRCRSLSGAFEGMELTLLFYRGNASALCAFLLVLPLDEGE